MNFGSSSGSALRDRIRPGAFAFMLLLVGAATYFEFVYYGPASAYAVVLWIVAVPMLFAATVKGVRDHPLYRSVTYAGLLAIGVLQYLDGNWFFLAGLFVLAGADGHLSELRGDAVSGPR